MAITTPSIQNQFNLSATPKDWLLTDTTDYTTFGLIPANVKGNFRLTAPNGIIHNNTSFVTPDTDLGAGDDDFSISLPLDSNNDALEGNYLFQYTIQITRSLSQVDQAQRQFGIAGDRADDLNSINTFTIDGSTGNDGTYTRSGNAVFNGVDTIVTVVETIPSPIVDGTLIYELVSNGAFEYCFEPPTVSIEVVYDCNCSQLESKDTSNYTAVCGTTVLIPITTTRTHTVIYPQGITPQPSNIVSNQDTITVTPIYTKVWQTTISTDLVYQNADGLLINYTATGQRSTTVTCDANLCDLSECLAVLVNQYKMALSNNYKQVNYWQNILIKAYGYFMLYSIAQRCGNESEACAYLALLKELVASSGCECGCGGGNSQSPVEIVPVCGPGGGTGNTSVVTTTLNGITVTASTVGTTTTYTLAINYATLSANINASLVQVQAGVLDTLYISPLKLKQYFASLGATRVLVTDASGNLLGAVQNTAFNRNFGINPNDVPAIGASLGNNLAVGTNGSGELITIPIGAGNFFILSNDQTAVPAPNNISENTLHTYTLTGGALANNGSYIRVTSVWNFSTVSPQPFNARIYFGSYSVNLAPFFPSVTGYVTAVLDVVRTGAATQVVYLTVIATGLPAATYLIDPVAAGENLAANVIIRSTSEFPSFPSRPNTLTSFSFKVEQFNA